MQRGARRRSQEVSQGDGTQRVHHSESEYRLPVQSKLSTRVRATRGRGGSENPKMRNGLDVTQMKPELCLPAPVNTTKEHKPIT